MVERFEKTAPAESVRVPPRFAEYPLALTDWTDLQRIDFEVWWASVPVGSRYACATKAIADLSRELMGRSAP